MLPQHNLEKSQARHKKRLTSTYRNSLCTLPSRPEHSIYSTRVSVYDVRAKDRARKAQGFQRDKKLFLVANGTLHLCLRYSCKAYSTEQKRINRMKKPWT